MTAVASLVKLANEPLNVQFSEKALVTPEQLVVIQQVVDFELDIQELSTLFENGLV